MKPELQLAALFKITPAEAQAYIQAIQKRFKNPPSATSLLIFIQSEKMTKLPSPPDMVRLMTRGRSSSGKVKPGYTPKPAADIPARQRRAGFSKTGLVYESSRDHERLPPEQQECCPHGVPKSEPCAICNPEEFRLLTGID